MTDPVGNVTTFEYDALYRLIGEPNQLSDSRSYVYNTAGQLTRLIDREGRVTQFAYEDLGWLSTETWYADVTDADAEQNSQNTFTFSYFNDGHVKTIDEIYADYEFTYTNLGQVDTRTETIYGLTPTVVMDYAYYAYNANGDRIETAVTLGASDDLVNQYSYTDLGQLATSTQSSAYGNVVSEKRVGIRGHHTYFHDKSVYCPRTSNTTIWAVSRASRGTTTPPTPTRGRRCVLSIRSSSPTTRSAGSWQPETLRPNTPTPTTI